MSWFDVNTSWSSNFLCSTRSSPFYSVSIPICFWWCKERFSTISSCLFRPEAVRFSISRTSSLFWLRTEEYNSPIWMSFSWQVSKALAYSNLFFSHWLCCFIFTMQRPIILRHFYLTLSSCVLRLSFYYFNLSKAIWLTLSYAGLFSVIFRIIRCRFKFSFSFSWIRSS